MAWGAPKDSELMATKVQIERSEEAEKVVQNFYLRLLEELDLNDDVKKIYSNIQETGDDVLYVLLSNFEALQQNGDKAISTSSATYCAGTSEAYVKSVLSRVVGMCCSDEHQLDLLVEQLALPAKLMLSGNYGDDTRKSVVSTIYKYPHFIIYRGLQLLPRTKAVARKEHRGKTE